MKISYKEFKTNSLRPAYYNGTQFDVDVTFENADLRREGVTVTEALNMIVGDTVRISGLVRDTGKKNEYERISIFLCGEELDDFIGKYGVNDISVTVPLKLELIYAKYYCEQFCSDPITEEVVGYKYICTVSEDGEDQDKDSDAQLGA